MTLECQATIFPHCHMMRPDVDIWTGRMMRRREDLIRPPIRVALFSHPGNHRMVNTHVRVTSYGKYTARILAVRNSMSILLSPITWQVRTGRLTATNLLTMSR